MYAVNCLIFLHDFSPSSDMPQVSSACNMRRDFANGAHVVIRVLRVARNSSMFVHVRNP